MKCSNCSHIISDGEKFCANCGQKIEYESENNYCSNCGSKMENDSQYCSNCGYGENRESKHNINNNQSNNSLSGKYDKLIYLGYGLTFVSFIIGSMIANLLLALCVMAIGVYILTRPNIKENSTGNGSFIRNPTEHAYVHGIILFVLPFIIPFIIGFIFGFIKGFYGALFLL